MSSRELAQKMRERADEAHSQIGKAIRAVERVINSVHGSDLVLDYGSKPYSALLDFKLDMALEILEELGIEIPLEQREEAGRLIGHNKMHYSRVEPQESNDGR